MNGLLASWWQRLRRSCTPRSSRPGPGGRSFRPTVVGLEPRWTPANLGGLTFPAHVYRVHDGAALESAVRSANQRSGSSLIILEHAGSYRLSSALRVDADVTIVGRALVRPGGYILRPGGGGQDSVVDVRGAHTVTLVGLTVEGGSSQSDGGGIDVESAGARLNLVDTVIRDNQARGNGGGVAVADGAGLAIINSAVLNNRAGDGGGGVSFEARSQAAQVFVTGTIFSGNRTGTGETSDGGGLLVEAKESAGASRPPTINLTVNFVNFLNNTSGHDGGGLWASDVTQMTATGIFAAGNSSVGDAGAVGDSVMHLNSAAFTFTNSLVAGNRVTGPGSTTTPDAGGVCFDFQAASGPTPTGAVTAVITGNVLINNTVAGAGGGLFVRDEAAQTSFSATISGNYVAANQALLTTPDPEGDAGQGGGIYLRGSAASNTVTISNNIVSGNSAALEGGGLYLRVDSGTLNLVGDQIVLNRAGMAGGGVFNSGVSARVSGSIIASNSAPSGPNFSGPYTDLGGNNIS